MRDSGGRPPPPLLLPSEKLLRGKGKEVPHNLQSPFLLLASIGSRLDPRKVDLSPCTDPCTQAHLPGASPAFFHKSTVMQGSVKNRGCNWWSTNVFCLAQVRYILRFGVDIEQSTDVT